jgi:uncharacterized membrane protein YdjX (TVP38/TMEM64 family)
VALLATAVTYYFGLKIDRSQIIMIVESAGIFGPVVLILFLALSHIVAPISGTPVLLVGYGLFGKDVIYQLFIATIISSSINFWIARAFGRGIVSKFAGQKSLDKIDQFTNSYGVKSLIFLRFFTGHLTDFISYAYGLTNIRFSTYITISALVPIPWLLLWRFYIFDQVDNLTDFTLWFFLPLIPFWLISLLYFKKLKK